MAMRIVWENNATFANFLCYSIIRNVILEKLIPDETPDNIVLGFVDNGCIVYRKDSDDDIKTLFIVRHESNEDDAYIELPCLGDGVAFWLHTYSDGMGIRPSMNNSAIENEDARKSIEYVEDCLRKELRDIMTHFQLKTQSEVEEDDDGT